jgi:group I intron endonuclease
MGLIYCLTFPNKKQYVGKTSRNLEKRISEHKMSSSKCRLLKNAINKYKIFEIEILLEIENDQLNYWESHYIKELNTISPNGYNLTSGGEGSIPSEETREAMRKGHSNRVVHSHWREQISKGLTGHKHSEETKNKIRQARLNNPIIPSEENRRKINEKIKTIEIREKGSKSRRKDNFDLPLYIVTIRKESNPGYCVQIPGKPQKYFTSKFLTMEEKLKLALTYREENYKL